MPSQIYPFYRFKYPNGSFTPPWRIYLPIRITNPSTGESGTAFGVVDTGADATLFPADLCKLLGHNLNGNGVKTIVSSGIEQRKVTIYKHTFNLELLSPKGDSVLASFKKIEIGCAESNPPVLLGASDFLTRFDLSILYHKQELALSW